MPMVASGGYYMQRNYPADVAAKERRPDRGRTGREARGTARRLRRDRPAGRRPHRRREEGVPGGGAGAGAHRHANLHAQRVPGPRQADAGADGHRAQAARAVLARRPGPGANVAIGHVCCLDDPKAEIAIEIARRGVFVGFDRVTIPDHPRTRGKKMTTILAFPWRPALPRSAPACRRTSRSPRGPEEERRRRPGPGRHRFCANAGEGGNAGSDVEDDPERQSAPVSCVRALRVVRGIELSMPVFTGSP